MFAHCLWKKSIDGEPSCDPEIWWLWRPQRMINIIFIPIKPFCECSCPAWRTLHLMCFSTHLSWVFFLLICHPPTHTLSFLSCMACLVVVFKNQANMVCLYSNPNADWNRNFSSQLPNASLSRFSGLTHCCNNTTLSLLYTHHHSAAHSLPKHLAIHHRIENPVLQENSNNFPRAETGWKGHLSRGKLKMDGHAWKQQANYRWLWRCII